jgi:hypothetical protein
MRAKFEDKNLSVKFFFAEMELRKIGPCSKPEQPE